MLIYIPGNESSSCQIYEFILNFSKKWDEYGIRYHKVGYKPKNARNASGAGRGCAFMEGDKKYQFDANLVADPL